MRVERPIRCWLARGLWPALALLSCPLATPAVAQEVAVDIGHTLKTHGATSARGRGEFYFNRDLAQALVVALQAQGVRTRLINGDGRIGSLQARPAEAAGTDLLISIHHDSVNEWELQNWEWQGETRDYNDDFAGYSLFVSRDNPDTARSILCARTMSARLAHMGFVGTDKNGRRRPFVDRELKVHYFDGLAVLRHATMPAVLFEAGVIKNRDEELLLQDPARIARMADGLATGIAACLRAGSPGESEATADRPDEVALPPQTNQ